MDEDRTAGGTKLIFCIFCRMWVDGIVFAWHQQILGGSFGRRAICKEKESFEPC